MGTKFMNAELIALRDSLTCGHCGCTFKGSDSQAWKVKYEKRDVYCSDICRKAGVGKKVMKPIPNRGPCPTCKNTFFSRTAKIFCSLKCYNDSPEFKEQARRNMQLSRRPESKARMIAKLRKGEVIKCLECEKEIYKKRNLKSKKYCSQVCYRAYMAKRFDRWIANPEGLALPQCYDEFLDKEELDCIIDGCDWRGKHLSLHVNQTHGVQAREFKRAAGFNLQSGIVSKTLAITLSDREKHGLGNLTRDEIVALRKNKPKEESKGNYVKYRSLECQEHLIKSRAIMAAEAELGIANGPMRICEGCGVTFQQKHRVGRKKFCTILCREETYARRLKSDIPRIRDAQGKFLCSDGSNRPETLLQKMKGSKNAE